MGIHSRAGPTIASLLVLVLFLLFQIREIVSKTREKKQQTKILLVKLYYKEKWAACFGAIFSPALYIRIW